MQKYKFYFEMEGRNWEKVNKRTKKNGFINRKQGTGETQTGDGRNKNSRLAKGRTVGCLSQTANENQFVRFLNNRNITPVTADIRKEEEKIDFTLHSSPNRWECLYIKGIREVKSG